MALMASLAWLAVIDLRTFEVSPPAAIATGLCMAAMHLTPPTPSLVPTLFALVSYASILLLVRLNPSRLGQGDATLFALIAFATGPTTHLPIAAAVFAVTLALTTLCLLLRRAKPLNAWRRHIVPAAPAAAAAILAATALHTESLTAAIALLVFIAAIPAAILPTKARHSPSS
ncbi:MAG: prepilin peptidase [Rhodobacteraceae bacterium]|nr:prepilin peptidase [Paracoccaceae bacterium]